MQKNFLRTLSIMGVVTVLSACGQKTEESPKTAALDSKSTAPVCELNRKVVFAGLDWDSNAFHTAVAQNIIKNGYGCEVDQVPGTTIPLLNGMAKGDIDVTMEIWKENITAAWNKATESGKVLDLGVNFPDAVQGWFIPKYLTEGPDAPAKDLKSVTDLVKYKDLFKDPEVPNKGRFYNCHAGWGCEVVNTKKLAVYQLNDSFTNFRSGTGSALSAAIESAIKQKKPIVFYYWGPTWLWGKIGNEVQMLEEPAYDETIWEKFYTDKNPTQTTAYPVVKVYKAVNAKFAKEAPTLTEFIRQYNTTSADVSAALAFMQERGGTVDDAAVEFLKTKQDVWTKWVPADVAARVNAKLQ
ncbi:ABC transporter substrate-binding protein [Hydromonas duriensis]|uniref:Glycine betaine/proline transport system substrate-binding protein n=1 Tax=Hydromonas duriensis TaxID=1527608 RepID=A0A4R6Y6U3_9BURK|nr:ABC transporter substrate-binding protein [Hydromonas duriensis]TDR27883.1 glycine betaine/proline transport system substrate-binding protein [Hydromonas duriensis]